MTLGYNNNLTIIVLKVIFNNIYLHKNISSGGWIDAN